MYIVYSNSLEDRDKHLLTKKVLKLSIKFCKALNEYIFGRPVTWKNSFSFNNINHTKRFLKQTPKNNNNKDPKNKTVKSVNRLRNRLTKQLTN